MKDREVQFFNAAMKKMFSAVGQKYKRDKCKEDGWWKKYQWTDEEERRFRSWYVGEMRKRMRVTKGTAEANYAWFNLMYGWTRKQTSLLP